MPFPYLGDPERFCRSDQREISLVRHARIPSLPLIDSWSQQEVPLTRTHTNVADASRKNTITRISSGQSIILARSYAHTARVRSLVSGLSRGPGSRGTNGEGVVLNTTSQGFECDSTNELHKRMVLAQGFAERLTTIVEVQCI
jgi:hypothetical protein